MRPGIAQAGGRTALHHQDSKAADQFTTNRVFYQDMPAKRVKLIGIHPGHAAETQLPQSLRRQNIRFRGGSAR
jgi:hypothetical protein